MRCRRVGCCTYRPHWRPERRPITTVVFGAFDFSVTPDGRGWFLECNPAGQVAQQVVGARHRELATLRSRSAEERLATYHILARSNRMKQVVTYPHRKRRVLMPPASPERNQGLGSGE
jgi:hypothetical protein